jgi:D-aminopeptidase
MTALSKPLIIKKISNSTKSVAKKSPLNPAVKTTAVKTVQSKAKPVIATKNAPKAILKKLEETAVKASAEKQSSSVVSVKTEKPVKAKKVKLVRDSFTIPKVEYLALDALKLRAADLKHPIKKGELLRAGIKALTSMTNAQLLLALQAVPALKTGRPSK